MSFYAAEEVLWKCPRHPSKRHRSGICPICLRERLRTLCPDCGSVRPCACSAATTSSPSSSSSSSFSIFSSSSSSSSTFSIAGTVSTAGRDGIGDVGRVGNLIESEPALWRSKSVGIPFLRSRFAPAEKDDLSKVIPAGGKAKTQSFWSVFKSYKSEKRGEASEMENSCINSSDSRIHDFERLIMKSRSVRATMTSSRGGGISMSSTAKGRGWHFPIRMKLFRQKSLSKVVLDRSPLHRA